MRAALTKWQIIFMIIKYISIEKGMEEEEYIRGTKREGGSQAEPSAEQRWYRE